MATTYFGTHSTWMRLKSLAELDVLIKAMAEVGYNGSIKSIINENDQATVAIERPDSSVGSCLRGDDYVKWEKVKKKVYAYRKNGKGS